jgi:hypothetical protein
MLDFYGLASGPKYQEFKQAVGGFLSSGEFVEKLQSTVRIFTNAKKY